MSKSLYNIEQEFLNLEAQIYEAEGEITEEIEQALYINKAELKYKAVGYSKVIKKASSEVDYIDKEIKRLQAEKKSRINLQDRLKQALTNAMNTYSIDKIETPICRVSFRKSSKVEVIDPSLLPDSVKVPQDDKILLKDVKELLKNGNIAGAKMVTNKSIQIK